MVSPARWPVITLSDTTTLEAAALIAHAFTELPATRWLTSNPAARVAGLTRQFAILVEHAHRTGIVRGVQDPGTGALAAVAVWNVHQPDQPPPIPDYDARLRAAVGDVLLPRFSQLDDTFHSLHPVGTPHQHLALLATGRGTRGLGLGTRLLQSHLDVLDSVSVSSYLEATTPRLVGWYQRFGFRVTADGPRQLPEGGPLIWPLWRRPGGAGG